MSSGASKGNPNKGVSTKAKPNKTDSKTDKADLNPKIQPTAEQMQIARIMDSHRAEDPELREKIKQVMEITRVSEDEACMALHSREYDIGQAITLLTDGSGQLLSSEWEQAGKKKKSKTPAAKNELPPRDKERGPKDGGRDRSEKRDVRSDKLERERKDSEVVEGQDAGNELRRNDRGDKGDRGARGGSRRGGRGRGGVGGGPRADNKENDEGGSRNFGGGGYSRISNGPGRGGRGGGGRGLGARGGSRDGTRTFASRTRGRDEEPGYHPIDVWENSQADAPAEKPPLKVDKWDEFPSAEDWDNEEYTGSLQETKVFTPSTQTQTAPPLGDQTNGVGPNHLGSSVSPAVAGDVGKISTVGSGDALGDGVAVVGGLNNVAAVPPSVVPGQSIDLSLLLQQQQQQKQQNSTSVSNAGANLLATLQSSYSSSASQVPLGNTNQALPPRHKVQRPRGPTTKIPSSAVEMPVDSVGTLDVQFGGLEFDDNSSMNFNSVLHGGSIKPNSDILYGAPPPKLDSFASAADKDPLVNSKAPPPQAPSPFQNQRAPQSNLVESVSSSAGVPISPNIDAHTLALQNQKNSNSPQASSYGNSANVGSAFVSYGKGAPGFPAPGFPPVTQTPSGTVTYSNSTAGNNGNSPGAAIATPYTSSSVPQSSYHNMGNLAYGSQPVVSAVQSSQIQSQPILPPVSQSPSAYTGSSSQSSTAYHHNANSSTPAYGSTPSGTNQYGNYGQKLQGTLSAQNVTSGHTTVKDSPSESSSSVPASGSSSANSVQMGNLQQGSVIATSSTSNPKISSASSSNVANASSGAKMGIPPGMVMQPQYILNHQSGMPAFYSLQAPFYGYDESSMQLLPRLPPHMQGYYDASGANYGNPMSFALEANAGGPGVSGRSDGTTLQGGFSGGSDARFPRSDSSTASPVPSNIAGQSTQQPIYNPGLPGGYYFVGNMHPGTFPYAPPPHMYPQTQMATPTNASGPPHAATSNHQYQNKGVYTPSYSYEGQGGPSTDFTKNSYSGGSGVGPNSSSGKTSSSASTGNSQTTDLNSSMYGKGGGHLNKMNYNDKPYANSGGYNSVGGTGSNPLNSQMSGAGMGSYGVYIAQQPVQALPLPQDGVNASRQGSGQQKGNKYGGAPAPYWAN